jgi:hypothetical protein
MRLFHFVRHFPTMHPEVASLLQKMGKDGLSGSKNGQRRRGAFFFGGLNESIVLCWHSFLNLLRLYKMVRLKEVNGGRAKIAVNKMVEESDAK